MRLEVAAAEEGERSAGGSDAGLEPAGRRPFTIRFSVSILILMAAILLPLSSTLLWLGWRAVDFQERRSVEHRMTALHNAVAGFIAVGVRVVISAAEALADTSDFDPATGPARDQERRKSLMELLVRHSNLAAAFVGYADGRFIYVSRTANFTAEERAELKVPANATFLFRLIDGQGEARRESWWFDTIRMPGAGVESRRSDFDPRTRPWYLEAMQRQGPALTDPYRFAWHTEAGVSAGVPIDGGGVIGFDFNLDALAQLLNEYKITPNSIIGVATDVADVVVESEPCSASAPDCLPDDAKARDILQTMAQRATGSDYRIERTVDVNGHDYRFFVQAAPPVYGKSMMIAAAVPMAELSAASIVLLERAALAGAVSIVVAIIGVLGISLLLARSMERLAAKTERIRRLDFSDRILVRSRITEILRLSMAVERMRAGLEVFGLYVSKELVGEIMRSPTSTGLGGTRRQLTVMFTDIEGFSRISEAIEPELLTSRLSRYFDALGAAISANRGMIDKYIGDSVMAFWNAPQPDPDHIYHACRAALEVSRASRNLAEKWRRLDRPVFHTRIGLHTGEAVVGNVGARQRINYTLVGAVANQASRLEALNKAYGTWILASGDVATVTAGRFVWRHIDRIVPAGTTEILDIYELAADVGETDELASFLAAWQAARDAYVEGRFEAARQGFEAARAIRGEDGPCRTFIERCQTFGESGVPAGWDGVWHFAQK
ncbi:MAG: hypothetical protein JSR90_11670 [Proteobacteria bacterium]|nr:hypothetical protein [Pseudomonadota bacterium]